MTGRAREEEDSAAAEEHSQAATEEDEDEEEKEEEVEDSKAAVDMLVTLKVVGQECMVRRTMKMIDKLQILKDVWYHKVPDVTYGTGVFTFNSSRFWGDSTPEDPEMEEGDMIDFFQHVDGGAFVA